MLEKLRAIGTPLRIAGLVCAFISAGVALAEGNYHAFTGWMVAGILFIVLLLSQ